MQRGGGRAGWGKDIGEPMYAPEIPRAGALCSLAWRNGRPRTGRTVRMVVKIVDMGIAARMLSTLGFDLDWWLPQMSQ